MSVLLRAVLPFVLLFGVDIHGAEKMVSKKWVVYFSDKAQVNDFKPYEIVVLDRFYHPPVRAIRDLGKRVFGYINIGEEEEHAPWFDEIKAEGILLIENEQWEKSHMIDLRDKRWVKRLVEEIIPFVLHKGFNGLFLDTLDNAEHLESLDGEKYKGMKAAAVEIVKAIRLNYPEVDLMVNRGFGIVEEIAPYIDLLLGEGIFTDYDFQTKKYRWNKEPVIKEGLDAMNRAKRKNEKLTLLSLDYWSPDDKPAIKKIYNRAREAGLSPYVSTIELNEIIPEP